MYPEGMTKLVSNMTPRSYKRMEGLEKSVWFGLQYYLKEYLIKQWNELFFNIPLEDVLKEYKRFHKNFSFCDIDTTHIEKLHQLGYMPLEILALPEGSLIKARVPYYVIYNTHPEHAWLVNFLETQMSTVIWDLTTNATIGKQFRDVLDKHAIETTGTKDFVQWQGHDFSMRGRSSIETSLNQAGWLLSFTGTDTIPAVLMLEEYYNANIEKELVGSSVPASEHSVMTSYGKEDEIVAFARLLNQFPTGIISVVSDSFDLWKVCTEYLPTLKDKILAREGKLVIRPDSGNPCDIICGKGFVDNEDGIFGGYYEWENGVVGKPKYISESEHKGVIELLWDVFGGIVNEQGYKVLDNHIGAIYGDAITLERAEEICQRLKTKGFASTNIVMGVGSYTMNVKSRDSLGIAVKSTFCEVDGIGREIFKDPITDSGEKKSAKGLTAVFKDGNGDFYLKDQATWDEIMNCELKPVFKDGKLLIDHKLSEIRERINA
jgi:nicotinamide phosphoribosyltransferase